MIPNQRGSDIPNHYSGDVLHRGTLKKLLTNRDPIQVHFPEILTWGQKISVLLRRHSIALFDGATVILAGSNNEQGQAFASIGQRLESPLPDEPTPPLVRQFRR